MDRYYVDEDLDFGQDGQWNDGLNDRFDDGTFGLPPGTDSIHNWDYFEPENEESERQPAFGDRRMDRYDDCLPGQLRVLLGMIRKQPWQITAAKSFYEQAQFMQDYEDDAEVVGYMNYFPTYRDMTVAQLRSYFTIRKQLRLGKAPDVSLSFLFVYVYETLMRIGVNTAEEGYEILCALNEAYRQTEPKLNRYLSPWIRDYVVYNNLSEHFGEVFPTECKQDEIANILSDYAKENDSQLFETVCLLANYDPRKAALYKKYPKEATAVMARTLRLTIPMVEKELGHRIRTLVIGKHVKRSSPMFANAVFYDPKPVRNVEITVSPAHRYFCRGGMWTHDEYIGKDLRLKKIFGAVMHEADCQLRAVLGVKPTIVSAITAYPYRQIIRNVISKWQEEERKRRAAEEAEKRRVSIDYSKLGRIRDDAEAVQDKLLDGVLIEERSPDNIKLLNPPSGVPAAPNHGVAAHATNTDTVSGATTESREYHFLHIFLSGGDWKQYLRDIHVPQGVMVENINNEMMDIVGNIVLEDNGNGLQIIEDYREEVEKTLSFL